MADPANQIRMWLEEGLCNAVVGRDKAECWANAHRVSRLDMSLKVFMNAMTKLGYVPEQATSKTAVLELPSILHPRIKPPTP